MERLQFLRMQGAGNDFVVLDLIEQPLPAKFDFPSHVPLLCQRRLGVGGDGLLTLEAGVAGTDVSMRMWNPDGTPDMCGNGLRCIGWLAWSKGHVQQPAFLAETIAGKRQVEILGPQRVRVAMGEPHFLPAQVPMLATGGASSALGYSLDVEGQLVENCYSLSTGSTHTVIFVRNAPVEAEFQRLSPLIENLPVFPQRTSVLWAVEHSALRYEVRIWERGAGETLACGTGACAVAVAARLSSGVRGTVEVLSRGGTLLVDWEPGKAMYLSGEARTICAGTLALEL